MQYIILYYIILYYMEKFLEYKNKYLYIKHFGGAKKNKKIPIPVSEIIIPVIIPVIKRVLIISSKKKY